MKNHNNLNMKQLLCCTAVSAAMLAAPRLCQAQAAATFITGTFNSDIVLALPGSAANEVYGVDWLATGPTTTANGYVFNTYSSGNVAYGSGGTDRVFFPSPNTTGDTGLDAVLNAGADQGITCNPDFVLKNLIAGVTYNMLLLDSDVRNGIGGPRNITVSDTVGDSLAGAQWITGTPSPVLDGSYVMATFTASGTTENFEITGNGGPQVNAVLVTTVPEPSTYALGIFSGLGMLLILRKKNVKA